MIKAFVFGKFLPFHKGHEAMINFALTKCDFLTVLVCASDKEIVSGEIRKSWIEDNFKTNNNIEVKNFNYLESELPNTSEPSIDVSRIWATEFIKIFKNYSLLITSEKYGEYVASYMNINHIYFDLPRKLVPISASLIKQNLFKNWKFLPNNVKPFYAIKIVILGTESTGKSTITKKLANYFECNYVNEIGRDLIENSNNFSLNDLQKVALEHAKLIESTVKKDSPLIIIDTDVTITKSYAKFIFNKDLKLSKNILDANKANLYFYLNKNVPYVQDGTRFDETTRDLLDISHRKTLKNANIKLIEINGDWETRFDKIVDNIQKYINQKITKI